MSLTTARALGNTIENIITSIEFSSLKIVTTLKALTVKVLNLNEVKRSKFNKVNIRDLYAI